MNPNILTLNIQKKDAHKVIIEMDIDRFERLAADLGLFQPEFLKSLNRAEREVSQKKLTRLNHLRDLRCL